LLQKKRIEKTCASQNPWQSVSLLLMTMAIWLMSAGASYGYIIINAPMTGSSSSNRVLGGNPDSSTISSSATPGTAITNTATVTNPNGTGATSTAPVVTLTGTVAGTGNKLLYLYSDSATTGHLNRAHATVNAATYVQINGGTAVSWALSPVLQSAVTITGGAGVTIPVQLYLSTNNTRTYTLNPITLTCGVTTLGTLTSGVAYIRATISDPFGSYDIIGAPISRPATKTYKIFI